MDPTGLRSLPADHARTSLRRRTFMATGTVQVVAGCIAEDPVPTPEKPDAATYEGGDADEGGAAGERPDVVEAKLTGSSDGQCTATVTISSPYDTPERYVDEWRVLTPEGDELSEHKLGHDHADEQRFTRENQPFANHDRVDEVTIEGRDLVNGYRGETATVEVPE